MSTVLAPLSPVQERVWFREQVSPGSAAYNIPAALAVAGPFRHEILRRVLAELIARHDSLRASVDVSGEDPKVRVAPCGAAEMLLVDLHSLPAVRRADTADRIVRRWVQRPFDLTRDPLVRAIVVRIEERLHRIVLMTHHFAVDGWSLQQLIQELGILYHAFSRNQPVTLPAPPMSYGEFATWQIEQLQRGAWDFQLDYWERQLHQLPPQLRLPVDRPRGQPQGQPGSQSQPASQSQPGTVTSRGATWFFDWGDSLNGAIRTLTRLTGATPFVTLLSALHVLLGRLTGQTDICVATAVSNRRHTGTDRVIGTFANDLILRAHLADGEGFRDVVSRAREVVAQALQHQDIPFHRVLQRLGADRSAHPANLTQVFFVLHQSAGEELRLGDLTIAMEPVAPGGARFDLAFELTARQGRYGGIVEYDAALFDPATIERIVGSLHRLLRAAADDPARPIRDLPLLSAVERQQLAQWNDTRRLHPQHFLVHRIFEDQARRTPDSMALLFGDERLTYGQLNARANQLARHLRAAGVARETLVGVLMERSIEMIVAVLGIIKAGAAYVPLDPSYPDERLRKMAADARLSLVLVQSRLQERVPEGLQALPIDSRWCAIGQQSPADLPEEDAGPHDLIYVIFTSGSTGRPKGAMNVHSGVRNRILWMQGQYGLSAADRVLYKTPYSFDVSVWEIFWPLLSGAQMVIARPGGHQDTAYLCEVINRFGVTTLHFVPSVLSVFLEEPAAGRCSSLRRVICSGEALPRELQERFFGRSSAELHNLYGPTEAAVDVSYWQCRQQAPGTAVPIGHPIDNIQLHVLDRNLEPVPCGVEGEIYIGGIGLARGYCNRPRETAARFVPNPFGACPGERLYRTGDLARRRLTGELEYVGRNDHQLKIHGCRVELGEVEAALSRHAGVRRAVVLARPDAQGELQLVAYVQPKAGHRLGGPAVRQFLASVVPAYMVPSACVIVERIALATHGKVDYQALPAPAASDFEQPAAYVEPQGATQNQLALIWQQVLGQERIGAADNFFGLGGNSMQALRVASLATRANLRVAVSDVFRFPTIRELAEHSDAAGRPAPASQITPFALVAEHERGRLGAGIIEAYPLTALQMGMVFHIEDLPEARYFHNVDSYRLRLPWDLESFRQALRELTCRHPILRTSFDLIRSPAPLQLVHAQAELPLQVYDLRALTPAQQEGSLAEWMEQEKATYLDITRAPLLRVGVHRLSDAVLVIGITHHHAILDGWSLNTLLTELLDRYRSGRAGQAGASPAAPDPIDWGFRHYVALEQRESESQAARNFWQQRLEGASITGIALAAPELPASAQPFGEYRLVIAREQAEKAQQLAQACEVPLRSLMLSLHLRVLGLLGRTDDVVSGVVLDARPDDLDPERVIGLFLNTVLCRMQLQQHTWRELCIEVFAAERELLPFRRYPFVLLKQQTRDPERAAVLFNFIDFSSIRARVLADRAEVLGGDSFVRTAGPLVVTFDSSPQADLTLILHFDHRVIDEDAARKIAVLYRRGLELLTSAPDDWSAPEVLSAVLEPDGGLVFRADMPDRQPTTLERSVDANANRYIAPSGPVEEVMAQLWGEVLGLERVSAEGDFFELGGHSLRATQLMARIRSAFGVELPLRTLFEEPRLRGLSAAVQRAQGRGEEVQGFERLAGDLARRYEPFALTEVQQAYWVGRNEAFELGKVAAHGYVELEGEVDLERLEAALNRLIERHEMLRAVVQEDGQQRILQQVPRYRIRRRDLREVGEAERERELLRERERLSHQVLAADRWPLFEVSASELPAGRVRLHVSVDVLIADGWSFQLLSQQLWKLYEEPGYELAPLEVSFRDYVLGLQRLRGGRRYERSLQYWRERLEELPGAPQLPLARRPEQIQEPRFERRHGELSAQAWQAVKREAARRGLTASAVALGVYAEVLRRYSRHQRFTLNLTLFNRLPLHEQVNELVGDFTTTLLVAVELGGESFAQRTRQLQQRLWEGLDHRYVSGVEVLRELSRQQGRAGAAVMPVVFTSALDLAGEAGEGRVGPPLETVYGLSQTPQVWLDMQVFEQGGSYQYNLDAVGELFPAGLLDGVYAAYRGVLEQLVREPGAWERPIGELLEAAGLPGLERAPGLEPQPPQPQPDAAERVEEGLHSGFLRQARREPQRVAVIGPGRSLSYGELESWSRRVRQALRERGIGGNELVGVLLGKSPEQIVAVLGTVRAGAAYLPLDPELPVERIRSLLQDGGVRVVLSAPGVEVELPAGVERLDVTQLQAVGSAQQSQAEDWQDEPVVAGDLAYVIYTSGSTGRPKGVSMTHRATLNTVLDINERFEVGAQDRVLGLSALSFDLSVYDIFGLLGAGGAVVLPRQGRDPAGWVRDLQQHQVTVWNSVPSSLQLLMDYLQGRGEGLPPGLRLILLSGDWIGLELAARVRQQAPQVKLVSLGGATEAAIWSIYHPIERIEPQWKSIPYGRALKNQRMLVLNEELERCPPWVSGEIYIGGVGLAQGYWADEARTAERFIRHPRTQERLYRTGDLGRYFEDGTIEFLGREDTQVKISGYRIELGEVEAALNACAGVSEAAVLVSEHHGSKRLIGYVVGAPSLSAAELRAELGQKLPEYMIPARLLVLPQFPRTRNGKLDRRALAQLELPPAQETLATAASAPLEQVIQEIWSQMLGAHVQTHDNFFESGGNSILAMQMIAQLQRIFRKTLSLAEFFSAPTVAALAAKLLTAQTSEHDRAAMTARPDPAQRFDPFPLTDIQEAYWVGRRSLVELGGVATHAYAEIDASALDVTRFAHAIRKVVDRHDMLRAIFLKDGTQQVLQSVPPYELQILDLSGYDSAAAESRLCALRETLSHQVLRTDQWPLFDIRVTRMPGGLHRLHISADILIADAWSFQIAVRELFRFYEDDTWSVPPLELSFRDYVIAERQLRESEAYSVAKRYWTQRLRELPQAPPLPLNTHPAALSSGRFARLESSLPREDWSRLKAFAGSKGLTPSGLLCALYAEVLGMWSGELNFTINLTVFNRLPLHEQVAFIVGDFTSTLLLEVRWNADSFAERAQALQQQLWRDLEHRMYSGVQVLRDLRRVNPQRARSLMPVVFTSTLGAGSTAQAEDDPLPWKAAALYGISQTPQVLLDHQVSEQAGVLRFNWDFRQDAFPEGMMQEMFRVFCEKLHQAHEEAFWSPPPPARVPRELSRAHV